MFRSHDHPHAVQRETQSHAAQHAKHKHNQAHSVKAQLIYCQSYCCVLTEITLRIFSENTSGWLQLKHVSLVLLQVWVYKQQLKLLKAVSFHFLK